MTEYFFALVGHVEIIVFLLCSLPLRELQDMSLGRGLLIRLHI